MKILVVEDNIDLNRTLKEILEMEGYLVDAVTDSKEAIRLLDRIEYDLIILDIMLPEVDGHAVAKLVREKGITTPIIMLTALGDLNNKLRGFKLGADDYVVKPFEVPELLARIEAVLKRSNMIVPDIVELADLKVDFKRRVVYRDGQEVDITPKLFCILEQLLKNRGKVVTYEMLAGKCWQADEHPSSDTLRAHMKLLRKLIGDKDKDLIKTLAGVGYRID